MNRILGFLGLAEKAAPLLNPTVLYALGIVFLLGSGSGAFGTYKVMTWREKAAVVDATTAVIAETHDQEAITENVSEKAAEKQVEIQVVTQTIVKEVTKYVTKKADANCPVPVGAVRLHDAAARGVPIVPDAAGKSHGAPFAIDDPSGLLLSQLMETIAQNYGRSRANSANFTELQGWVRQQQALSAARR